MPKKTDHKEKPWLNVYGSQVPYEISYDTMTIPAIFMKAVRSYPDHTALQFKGHKVSYARLLNMVNILSCCLKKFGVKKGDAVGIILPNVIASVVSYYATLKIGGVVVMINPACPDDDLEYRLNDSGAKVVVTLDVLADRMIALRKKSKIERVVYISQDDDLSFIAKRILAVLHRQKGQGPRVSPARDLYAWNDILAERPLIVGEESISLHDVAAIQYTDDSGGKSKGVMLTHGNLSRQLQQLQPWFPGCRAGQEKMICAIPFSHSLGTGFSLNWAIMNGWEMILVSDPEPGHLLRVIKKTKPDIAVFACSIITELVKHTDFRKADLSFIHHCLLCDGPLAEAVLKGFEEKIEATVFEGYGWPETTAISHLLSFSDRKQKNGSIGIPISDTFCRLADLDDPQRDAPVGVHGELLIKGPQVMQGYAGKTDDHDRGLSDGWFHTGDVAYMDKDGFFYTVDRVKDMIVSAGHHVYPREIEEVIALHPKVSESCTIGVPHQEKGETVKLFVVLKKGESASPDEFIAFCKDKIDSYKCPSQVEIREELPKTHVGSVFKQKLKDDEHRRSHSF